MKSVKVRFIAMATLTAMLAGGSAWAAKVSSSDKKFIEDSTQGSLAEINYAKLALQKSQDKNVREFATKMVKDHEQLIADMKPVARQLGVKLPTGPPISDHAKYMELKMKSGTDFDRAYVEAMVKDHHDDLQAFMTEESSTTNPELKEAVAKGLAVVKEHTMMIDKIAHMGGIQTPPMPTEAQGN